MSCTNEKRLDTVSSNTSAVDRAMLVWTEIHQYEHIIVFPALLFMTKSLMIHSECTVKKKLGLVFSRLSKTVQILTVLQKYENTWISHTCGSPNMLECMYTCTSHIHCRHFCISRLTLHIIIIIIIVFVYFLITTFFKLLSGIWRGSES